MNKHKHGKNAEITLEQSMFTMLYLYDMAYFSDWIVYFVFQNHGQRPSQRVKRRKLDEPTDVQHDHINTIFIYFIGILPNPGSRSGYIL